MWPPPANSSMTPMTRLVAVAIDKDRGSQIALKWASDNLLVRGQTVILVHVRVRQSAPGLATSPSLASPWPNQASTDGSDDVADDPQIKELFLPLRVLCTRKDIQRHEVVLDDADVTKALIDFAKQNAIDMLVLGATNKGSIFRFKAKDIPGTVLKNAPDFCTVYIIHKGKISSTRAASRPPPSSQLRNQILLQASIKHNAMTEQNSLQSTTSSRSSFSGNSKPGSEPSPRSSRLSDANFKSPFTSRRGPNGKAYDISPPDTDISFVSSRRSVDVFPTFSESFESGPTPPRLSGYSEVEYQGFDSWNLGRKSVDVLSPLDFTASPENDKSSFAPQSMDEVEAEMRRLKQELKQTMDMYSTACKEALTAREKAKELTRWKLEEQKRLDDARLAEEAALALAEKEKMKSKAALEHAEAAQRIAEMEAQKRITAEMKALKEAEDKGRVLSSIQSDCRYRRYTIEEIEVATEYFAQSRKIGEGGYGPVYKCYLDHTPCAVKVLRPDATHGRSQFNQEVEILSCIRHPNMVLLLGACPEYGCLVYEYMSNGSLEDRLFQRGKTPPLSWQNRFQIAAEIGTGLLFLHQTKPEPLVHRDLKPANILLDRNYVSKISDVGLARLVPPSVADNVTQYRLTSTAGTFCYIDPEYQQTGMLGVKSDIYSLGIIFLQILTAKPPMGLTHHVGRAIEQGTFGEMLDPSVQDWPYEEALNLAKLSLKCSELRRKDRPDLGNVILPELNKLRELAEDSCSVPYSAHASPCHSQVSIKEDLSFQSSTHSSMGS
ncbi:kinase with adenine nucleotide alpha hydrolases-like domain-containing protein [Perilla frutescens var. hirtella]|uniref:RING-type E3 ubiquitin transferase n=1 Tax=Perilla frutescens var. hirtella TaxID=608512 RepID=A0AAD4JNR7_PERFH|nr:kinase with adenine nucleotide alpha hydrolases-like domain-containing protein [Perilla frutescens var. hirtella]